MRIIINEVTASVKDLAKLLEHLQSGIVKANVETDGETVYIETYGDERKVLQSEYQN